jgi:hypothetical protein
MGGARGQQVLGNAGLVVRADNERGGIPRDAAKAASCGPRASARRSEISDTTMTETAGLPAPATPISVRRFRTSRNWHASAAPDR